MSTINNTDLFLIARGTSNYQVTAADVAAFTGGGGGSFVVQTVPTAPAGATANAVIPGGTTAQRQTTPAVVAGEFRYNTTDSLMEFYDGANWVSLASVSATTTFGLGLNVTGQTVKLSVTKGSTPPATGTGIAQAIDGSMYWDDEYGSFFYRYNDGTRTQWVQVTGSDTAGGALAFPAAAPAATYAAPNGVTYTYDGTKGVWTQGGGAALSPATLAEAAAGTINTKYSSPLTSVPKDASGMTGAAIIPTGTTGQRPGAPAAGWLRHNTTTDQWFGYDGSDWVPFDQRRPVVTSADVTAVANDYVVVDTAGVTVTLPASPEPGTCVTVVVAGTFLDTVVARNGSNIMALAQDITLDKQYAAMQFTYSDATNGWRLN